MGIFYSFPLIERSGKLHGHCKPPDIAVDFPPLLLIGWPVV
tara:strand:+ start:521 stop:643 length:123 start_codon:yes stop_codon:yes gene_type:complete